MDGDGERDNAGEPEDREQPLIVGMKLRCPALSQTLTGKECEDQRMTDRYFCATCTYYLSLMGL